MKWLRAIGFYLTGELGFLIFIDLFFRAPWLELVILYLVFAALMIFFLFLVWCLRTWERYGPSPRQLALAWGLGIAVYAFMADCSFAYAGVVLGIIKPQIPSDWGYWCFAVVVLILCASIVVYQGAYRMALQRKSGGT